MMNRSVQNRLPAFLLAFTITAFPLNSIAATGTTISGRILDAQAGLPVPNATIALAMGGTNVASATTDASGQFTFPSEPPGTYSVTIRAAGYQTTIAPDLLVAPGQPEVSFQTAVNRQAQGLKQIASVATAGRSSLQTSS
ncbi:MAG TPA: carboxypeptidase-like regulatory domain-containing protein, partial [Candidatus Acidoferrales bacterium]|nr:carboxypeptidase-like regulatory domain-containing protein [Candidatus Acidoferrales bacterium]